MTSIYRRKHSQTPLSQFVFIIELPPPITDRLIANDQAGGAELKALARHGNPDY